MEELLTLDELASYLRLHRTTIYRMLRNGEIQGIKIGRQWRFNPQAVLSILKPVNKVEGDNQ